jgi:hypothetical protein
MFRPLFLHFLFLTHVLASRSGYYQIRSNKYPQEILPFSSLSTAIMDKNGHCFVAISTDHILYTSRKNYFINSSDIQSELNPYSSWFPLKKLTEIPNDDKMMPSYLLLKAADTILVITSLSIVELSMNYFCNEIVMYEYRVLFENSEEVFDMVFDNCFCLPSF